MILEELTKILIEAYIDITKVQNWPNKKIGIENHIYML